VVEDEVSLLQLNERVHRTLLSKGDTVEIFKRAIEVQENTEYIMPRVGRSLYEYKTGGIHEEFRTICRLLRAITAG
jgi:hypothetical protein